MAGHPSSVVAVADDVAPTSRGSHPREAISNLQQLLYIVEDWGQQLHITFGVDKCRLLITAKPHKLKQVETLLAEEPELLTFYGLPVQQVEDSYIHIGVAQAPRKQSAVAVETRITKMTETCYMMQDVTRNSLLGVSPLANRNIFQSYHSPVGLFGLDTVHMNKTDMARLEVKYRGELKRMMALPDHTPSAAVYLMIGVMPAEAVRDLEILGLFGQVAVCSSEQ